MSKVCNTCNVSKESTEFEAKRAMCKVCRKASRAESVKKAVKVNPDNVEKPKACINCGKGPALVDFKWRTDTVSGGWRNECNSCYNNKGYCEKSRAKSREEDKDAFLARNAATHLVWAHKNPDKIKEQQFLDATVSERKISKIKTTANYRDIEFIESDKDLMMDKLNQPCKYCSFLPSSEESLNGLDRVNPNGPYSDINTVPACATCNAIKCVLDINVFIDRVRQIKKYNNINKTNITIQKIRTFAGHKDLRDAPPKNKDMSNLTRQQLIKLWADPCYLCGHMPSFGIDRIDANKGYTLDNTAGCCSTCNYMKKNLVRSEFLSHIWLIYNHTKTNKIEDVSNMPVVINNGKIRELIKIDEIDMVFPSPACASKVFGTERINKLKCTWSAADPCDFRSQNRGDLAEIIERFT